MINNATLKEIGETLFASRSVILFPHENPDGDSIGSCVALCRALREKGIESYILIDDELPEMISFIDDPEGGKCCTDDPMCIKEPDVCALIDCGNISRIPGREEAFRRAGKTICIDHHVESECHQDLYYIDSEEASTTQIIYKLLKEMDAGINRPIANAIYTGICTDTGNFQYSNTSAETHRIATELFALGVDHNEIMVALNQNVDPRQNLLESVVMPNVEYVAEGKGAVACVTADILDQCGAKMEHADHLINVLRDTKGVEIGAVLKGKTSDRTKASFRAKSYADVRAIARRFGGGGHIKASGCTIEADMDTAKALVIEAIEEYFRNN